MLRWIATTVALLACLLAGCGGGDDDDRADTPPPPPPPAETEPERPLEAAWYEDPDGDFMPTAIEEELGTDPEVNECLQDLDCPGISKETGLPVEPKPPSTLLMLDASGSMAGPAGGSQSKIAAARESLATFVAGSPRSFDVGFAVFGHEGSNQPAGKRESCAGTDVLAPVGAVRPGSFRATLRRFEPTGYTPIARALQTAPPAFEGIEGSGRNRIVLVTDGIETCGGDPVAEARKLKQAGIAVTVDVVGFDIGSESDRRRLRAIARASGGTYSDAQTGAELRDYFDNLRRRATQLTEASVCASTTGTDISNCASTSVTDASLAIGDLASEASRAGDPERSDELERVRDEMNDAHERYDAELQSRFEAIDERLEREQEEAEERLEDSSQAPGGLATAPRLCPASPFVRSRMLLPGEALALARRGGASGGA